ncbi:MAG: tetratricopeptide repeat protein [Cryomorphaceae bacterium]
MFKKLQIDTLQLRRVNLKTICLVLFFAAVQGSFGQESSYSAEEQKCLVYIDSSRVYTGRDLIAALAYADSSYALMDKVESETLKILILSNLGDVYGEIADWDRALSYYFKAKNRINNGLDESIGEVKATFEEIDILIKIGSLNIHQEKLEKSLKSYEEALSKLEGIIDMAPSEEVSLRKIRLFNNIAAVYIYQSDYDNALRYIQNGLEINKEHGDKNYEALMENNVGICYLEKGEYDLANHHFLKSLSLHKEIENPRGQAQTLNSLGKNQASKGNFREALKYFEEALSLGKEIGNGKSVLISLESLSLTYDTLGQYKKALSTYKEYKTLNDSIFSTESEAEMARLEDAFRRDKEKKLFEIEVHREKAERQKAELQNLKIGGALGLLLLAASLVIVMMRGKIKNAQLQQQKLSLEREKLELERITLQESLDFKDRELTANALFLVKNNELISKIAERLLEAKDTFKQENQKIIQDIVMELRSSQDKHLWQEFEAHFTRVHSDFYQKLQEKYPNLTANEKKLCAFLRLNMSTKDISAITYQSINSITVARSRLRKKLNIEGEDIHLVNYLMEF